MQLIQHLLSFLRFGLEEFTDIALDGFFIKSMNLVEHCTVFLKEWETSWTTGDNHIGLRKAMTLNDFMEDATVLSGEEFSDFVCSVEDEKNIFS